MYIHTFTLQLSLRFLVSITLSFSIFGGRKGICLFMISAEKYFGLCILSFQERKKAAELLNSF